MKITSEKKGIFLHFSHMIWTRNFNETIFITMDSKFPLKVLVINKSKNTHHKYQQLHTLECKVFHWIWYPVFGQFL